MKRIITFVFALFLVAGCAEQAEYAAETQGEDAGHEETVMQRPDALNPINENLEFPSGWEVRLDSPDADATISADTTDDRYLFLRR